jgi:hypothetical protein
MGLLGMDMECFFLAFAYFIQTRIESSLHALGSFVVQQAIVPYNIIAAGIILATRPHLKKHPKYHIKMASI